MIPPAVRQFLDRRVATIEELEVLLLLYHQADRSWSAEDVAGALRFVPRSAAHTLEALGRRDLLDVRVAGDVRYRYSPATDTLASAVRQLADCYREERHAVVAQLLRPRRSLREFSDAFTLRSRKGNT